VGYPGVAAAILIGSGDFNLVLNNVVRNNGVTGITIGNGATNSIVYNNTVVDNTYGGIAYGNQSGSVIKNNLLSGNSTRDIYADGSTSTPTFGTNRCGSLLTGCATTAAPSFANAGASDYNLAAGSAMIDACTISIGALPPPLTGSINAIYNGSLPDCGAFESIPFASASATTTSVLDITFGAAYAPLSTLSSCTGVTVRQAGVTKTCTGFANNGNATYRWTCTACLSAGGGAIDISIAASKFTDSIAIGNALNQGNFTITQQAVTNNIAGTTEVFTVRHFRQRTFGRAVTDTIGAAWLKSEDIAGTVRVDDGKFSVLFSIDCTIADCPSVGFQFEYNKNGGAWAALTDSCLTNDACYDSTNSAAPHGTVIPNGLLTDALGNYLAGAVAAQANSYPVLDLALNQSTQLQVNAAIKTGLVAGTDIICIRPKLDSGVAMTHAQTACLNVVNPAGSPA